MNNPDETILKQLDERLPIRARQVSLQGGSKRRFELTDKYGREVQLDGISGLRIIHLFRQYGYVERLEEINAFDCELVFDLPPPRPVIKIKRRPHPLDDDPIMQYFF